MDVFCYRFRGYESYYQDVLPKLETKILALQNNNYNYILALNEAVCNAARYAIQGLDNVEIEIQMKITMYDISATIRSQTCPFDVEMYRQRILQQLEKNQELYDMDWGEFTANTEKGRGFWYMLTGCDYIYMDESGQEITLCARIPYEEQNFTKKMGCLMQRFFIKKNGVIR